MEYSPPPLFKQGASARAKVVIFSLIAIALLVIDFRLHALPIVRSVVGTALYPFQMAALMPRNAFNSVANYFASLRTLEKENLRLRTEQVTNAQVLQQSQQLAAENAHLRRLLDTRQRILPKSLLTEILYDARDPFSRKIVLDRGSRDGVHPGQPVIDDSGVVGQVTRVFPFTSEATLLTDKDQAIPVQTVRNGLRSIAYGRGQSGVLELRFMATNADIRKDDLLVTSGIDGIYPAGLAVAKVVQVETKSADAFARILLQPAAGIDRNRQLLILLTDTNPPPRPPVEDGRDRKTGKRQAQTLKDTPKEKEAAKDAVAPVMPPVKEPAKPGTAPAPFAATATPTAPATTAPATAPAAPVAKPAAVANPGKPAVATPTTPVQPVTPPPAQIKTPGAPDSAVKSQGTVQAKPPVAHAPSPTPPSTQPAAQRPAIPKPGDTAP